VHELYIDRRQWSHRVNSITQGLPDSGVFLGIPLSRWNFHAQIVHAAGLEKGGSVLNYKQKTVARKIT
jgi:hypothetical protein